MNDRYRNVCKALDHIAKWRTKEAKTVFIPYWGYVVTPSEELLHTNDTRKVICGDWECEEKQRFELRRASCRKGKQK